MDKLENLRKIVFKKLTMTYAREEKKYLKSAILSLIHEISIIMLNRDKIKVQIYNQNIF